MGRLIDADAFEKFIKEKYKDGESTDDIKEQMLFDLSYQPTAYNPKKVVEQLKRTKKEITKQDSCYHYIYKDGVEWMGEKAISIVRKGGV